MKRMLVRYNNLAREIYSHIISFGFLCFLLAISSIWQIAIKLELADGVLPFFSERQIDLFYNISISYLAGYILWLLTTFLPSYNFRAVQKGKLKGKIKNSFVLLLGLINKHRLCDEALLDIPSIFEDYDIEDYKIKVQNALNKTDINGIINELRQGRFLPTLKQIEEDNLILLSKTELKVFDSLIKNLTLLYMSSKSDCLNKYLTGVMVDLFQMHKI